MTKPQTALELARHDAQELHKRISDNIAEADRATWAEVKAIQADNMALVARMQTLTEDQSSAVKSGIKAAITKMEAAGNLFEDKAIAATVGVKNANMAMLDSAHRAASSLSTAIADARTKLGQTIEPKKVVA